ncbi:MAG: hypothetical protein EOP09_11840 [Proteobacteria bacterium]|nr:MAG: hypothetical protein EOP09_11840 [Pseudomonadota bacterium]
MINIGLRSDEEKARITKVWPFDFDQTIFEVVQKEKFDLNVSVPEDSLGGLISVNATTSASVPQEPQACAWLRQRGEKSDVLTFTGTAPQSPVTCRIELVVLADEEEGREVFKKTFSVKVLLSE